MINNQIFNKLDLITYFTKIYLFLKHSSINNFVVDRVVEIRVHWQTGSDLWSIYIKYSFISPGWATSSSTSETHVSPAWHVYSSKPVHFDFSFNLTVAVPNPLPTRSNWETTAFKHWIWSKQQLRNNSFNASLLHIQTRKWSI